MVKQGEIKTYFVTIPAHKFLHIRNYESIGYYDFWQRQSQIPGQDCATICGLLASTKVSSTTWATAGRTAALGR